MTYLRALPPKPQTTSNAGCRKVRFKQTQRPLNPLRIRASNVRKLDAYTTPHEHFAITFRLLHTKRKGRK